MIQDIITNNQNRHINDKQIAVLKENFPSCFSSDGSFDIERFKEEIKDKTEITHEGYELKFLGKSYAKLLASTDSTTVIVPDEKHNELPENKESENLYISGDNLDGLKHLLNSYYEKVKCIYIDPPYNTGTDGFVYNDNFNYTTEELQEKLSIDETQANRILDLSKRGSASHSAWLMFMYPRLLLARNLLTSDGVIFISIDDNEQSNLKLLCDDVFGEENFISQIVVQSNKRGQTYKQLAKTHEYLLLYVKNDEVIINQLKKELSGSSIKKDEISEYSERELRNRNPKYGRFNRPNLFYPIYVNPNEKDENGYNPISLTGDLEYSIEVLPLNSEGGESCWRWGKTKFDINLQENTMYSNIVGRVKSTGEFGIYEKYRKKTFKAKTIWFDELEISEDDEDDDGIWDETAVITEQGSSELRKYDMGDYFDFPKPTFLIKKVLTLGSNNDSVCLDFFSGSGSFADAVLKLNADGGNRKYIVVQLPLDLNARLMAAPATDKPKIQKTIDFLAAHNYKPTLDYVGIERIKRAAAKIKEERSDKNLDLGFKHFLLQEPPQNTLDKCETFDKAALISDATILDDFGPETVLTTWLNNDGYGLSANAEEIDLGGYTAYYKEKHLYLIYPDFTQEALERLLTKYDADVSFNPENIILFGYSFSEWSVTEMLEKNLKILNDSEKNLKINYSVRY
ncbi:site-specific DNA-methyltransferase [Chryseobacterium sp. 5_R23647]|uniref:site-specific DNA-methyltransferase n=1 Tax=Chryseobacterium sp. 5_R23647 TaxID=2258964 RepID=UPI000E2444FA|nr:site-specific DNA-methyltransferase [Chryseobacterium sp. 5_R23647]REC40002.1 site-specific DNA-methyltransferase [Chryseobacterium sp. 5_R23647]